LKSLLSKVKGGKPWIRNEEKSLAGLHHLGDAWKHMVCKILKAGSLKGSFDQIY
jgi:hypothetical protein